MWVHRHKCEHRWLCNDATEGSRNLRAGDKSFPRWQHQLRVMCILLPRWQHRLNIRFGLIPQVAANKSVVCLSFPRWQHELSVLLGRLWRLWTAQRRHVLCTGALWRGPVMGTQIKIIIITLMKYIVLSCKNIHNINYVRGFHAMMC